MSAKRQLAILAAALVFIGAGVLLIKAKQATPVPKVATSTVVVATKDIAPLQALQQGDLTTRTVPLGTIPGALGSIPFGSAARVPLVAGQVVMPNDIGPAVPQGKAIVGIQTNLAQSSGMLRPGQRVEIIAVVAKDGGSTSSYLGRGTVLVLNSSQGVPVVSGTPQAGQGPGSYANNSQPEVPAEVTLMVAQTLAPQVNAADAAGKIYLDIIP